MDVMEKKLDGKNQSLKEMLVEQAMLLEDILDGVLNEEQEKSVLRLEVMLPTKVDGWISVLKKDGLLDYQKEKLKEKSQEISDMIEAIENEKKKKLFYLHDTLTEIGLERLDGLEFYMKKDISYKTMVNMELVDDEFKRWILPELNNDEYELLTDTLGACLLLHGNDQRIAGLLAKLDSNHTYKCGVKDLPEGHPALVREVTPTVRFYKRSVKDRKAS